MTQHYFVRVSLEVYRDVSKDPDRPKTKGFLTHYTSTKTKQPDSNDH